MKLRSPLEVVAFPSDLGWMALQHDGQRVHRLTFGHETRTKALKEYAVSRPAAIPPQSRVAQWVATLQAYAQGEPVRLNRIPVVEHGHTEFEQAVRKSCRAIAYGHVVTYGDLAEQVGRPGAARAVGNVMRKNPTPLLVPCHRVVGTNNLGGFSAPQGLPMKEHLLVLEMTEGSCPCCAE